MLDVANLNIKYEIRQSKIEGVLPEAAGGVERHCRADSPDLKPDRLALNSLPGAELAGWQRLPWLEQKLTRQCAYQQQRQDQYWSQGEDFFA